MGRKDKQKERSIAAQCETSEHPPRLAVHDIDILVAVPIAVNLERHYRVSEFLLELMLRAEGSAIDIIELKI